MPLLPPPPVLDGLLGLLEPLLGRFQVPVQGQAGGLVQVGLHVHQVGAVLGRQALLGVGLQPLGQVAGDLDDRDGQALQGGSDGAGPGVRVPLGPVGFQHEEVGDRLEGHQAGLFAVEVLVLAQGNVLGRHAWGQLVPLLLVVVGQQTL